MVGGGRALTRQEVIAAFQSVSGFVEFSSGKVCGLWKLDGDCVDILAIETLQRGKGHCSRFIDGLMKQCRRVRFLHVDNPILRDALLRRGFREVDWYHDGEPVDGMVWRK
jgi:hypothetical protein